MASKRAWLERHRSRAVRPDARRFPSGVVHHLKLVWHPKMGAPPRCICARHGRRKGSCGGGTTFRVDIKYHCAGRITCRCSSGPGWLATQSRRRYSHWMGNASVYEDLLPAVSAGPTAEQSAAGCNGRLDLGLEGGWRTFPLPAWTGSSVSLAARAWRSGGGAQHSIVESGRWREFVGPPWPALRLARSIVALAVKNAVLGPISGKNADIRLRGEWDCRLFGMVAVSVWGIAVVPGKRQLNGGCRAEPWALSPGFDSTDKHGQCGNVDVWVVTPQGGALPSTLHAEIGRAPGPVTGQKNRWRNVRRPHRKITSGSRC